MIPKYIEQRGANTALDRPLAGGIYDYEHAEIYPPWLASGGRGGQRSSGEDFDFACNVFGNRGVFDSLLGRFFNGAMDVIKVFP